MTDETPAEAIRQFEMGATLADFHRLLPRVDTVAYDPATREFAHAEDRRSWTLRLSPQRERRIASVRLPVVDATFVFHGYTPAEVEAVVQRFLASFRRGGG